MEKAASDSRFVKPAEEHVLNLAAGSVTIVIVVAVLSALGYFLWFVVLNNHSLSTTTAAWGEFGDFFGGVLNPMIAFFALFWVAYAVRLQKSELSATRETLEKTLEAQQLQVANVLATTKLQYLSMRIQALSSQIETERAYVHHVMMQAKDHGDVYAVVNKDGQNETASVLLKRVNDEINKLDSERKLLVGIASTLAPDLRTTS